MTLLSRKNQLTRPRINVTDTAAARWLFLLFLFLLPIQTRWIIDQGFLHTVAWEYGTISLYGIDIIFILFLCALLVHCINHQKRFQHSLPLTLAIALSVIAFFSLAFAANVHIGLFWWLKLSEGLLLFACIHLAPVTMRQSAIAFVASGVMQSVVGWIQFAWQHFPASKWVGISALDPNILGTPVIEGAAGRLLRAMGTLPHPNILGGLLTVALLCAVQLAVSAKTSRERLLWIASIILMSAALWITFSRQAWVGLGVAIIALVMHLFFTQSPTRKADIHQLKIPLLALVLPLIIFTFAFPDLISTRFFPTPSHRLETKSINERADAVHDTARILHDTWVEGVGIGNFTLKRAALHDAPDERNNQTLMQPVHNIYLLLFTELGLFGLLVFLSLLVLLLVPLNRKDPWQRTWGLAFITLLVIGLFDHYLWSLSVGILLFWSVAGLVFASRAPTASAATGK